MGENAAFGGVLLLVDNIVRVVRILIDREGLVEFRLADVGFEAVDVFQGGIGVDRQTIRGISDELAYEA